MAGTLTGTLNFKQRIANLAPRWGVHQRQVNVTGNGRQNIVEIMRNATGHGANGLKLLCLPQLPGQ